MSKESDEKEIGKSRKKSVSWHPNIQDDDQGNLQVNKEKISKQELSELSRLILDEEYNTVTSKLTSYSMEKRMLAFSSSNYTLLYTAISLHSPQPDSLKLVINSVGKDNSAELLRSNNYLAVHNVLSYMAITKDTKGKNNLNTGIFPTEESRTNMFGLFLQVFTLGEMQECTLALKNRMSIWYKDFLLTDLQSAHKQLQNNNTDTNSNNNSQQSDSFASSVSKTTTETERY